MGKSSNQRAKFTENIRETLSNRMISAATFLFFLFFLVRTTSDPLMIVADASTIMSPIPNLFRISRLSLYIFECITFVVGLNVAI